MKFFVPIALLIAAVSAQGDDSCDAANIVESCLSGERAKMKACGPADYDCQCYAAQAIATCYNNCPKDPRKTGAEGDIQIYCGQASIYGSRATAGASMSSTGAAGGTSATPTGDSASSSTGSAGAKETGNSAAGMKAGSLLLAAAGMMAVV